MKSRIFFKLFLGAWALIALATVMLDGLVLRSWRGSLSRQVETGLAQKTELASQRIPSIQQSDLPSIVTAVAHAADARVTVISQSGLVLADSDASAESMENHSIRPEFRAALAGRPGRDLRRSHTGVDVLYVALPISGGAIRLACPLAEMQKTVSAAGRALLLAAAIAVLIAALLAAIAARAIAARFERIIHFADRVAGGDLQARLQDDSRDEIAQVAASLDRSARQLEQSFAQLNRGRAEMEVVLNSMQDGVLSVGAEGRLLWVNRSLRSMLHPLRIGAPLAETVRDPQLLAAVHMALTGATAQAKVRLVTPGRIFDAAAAPMPGGAAVAVLHDITDLERTEKTRRDFIANVSHELRTPLTSIQGYSETLLDSAAANSSREFLDIIRKNALRMSRLTEDLLTLARVESGEQKLQFEDVAASDLIADAVSNLRALARERGVGLSGSAPAGLMVRADRDAIQQVFNNLVENAMRYASEGRLVELSAQVDGSVVEFAVRDYGPGIGFEHLPRLFERFYRVDKARSRETGGTGLGLAIVKHIILNHGGAVRVESQMGHGAVFYFSLPLVAAAAPAAAFHE